MKNILFIAPPNGGKGTQSEALVENFGYIHISTGDLLRDMDKTTPLGQEIAGLMASGKFVSDELIFELLKGKLETLNGKPFILDGCPRNLHQAEMLESMLNELGLSLDAVIYLDVPYDILLKRALGRVSCPECKSVYNTYFKAPKTEGVCDKCGGSLIHRDDDTEETFKVRFDTYMESTAPLVDFYKNKGKLYTVDGVENVYDEVVRVIKND